MQSQSVETLPHSRSIRDLARAHGLSVPTVYRLIDRGELIARKVGRRTFITSQDEAAWLASLPRFGDAK